jgi:hypothetical protein
MLDSYCGIYGSSERLLDPYQNSKLRETLQKLCLAGSLRVRRRAVEAFGYLPRINDEEKQFLVSLIERAESGIAPQAVISLGRQTWIDPLETLRPYLTSEVAEIRKAADEAFVRCLVNRFDQDETDEHVSPIIETLLQVMGADPARLYDAILAAANHRFLDSYRTNTAKLGGLFIERFPEFLQRALDDLTSVLERPQRLGKETINKWLDKQWIPDAAIFDIATAAVERLPTAFITAVDVERIQPLLVRFTREGNSLTDRANSVTLLSFMRKVTVEVASAINAELSDVVDVQDAVLKAVERFRRIEGEVLPRLAESLLHPDASVAYATVLLFQALGLAATTSFEDRQRIMKLLADAIEDASSRREVYVLTHDVKTVPLENGERSVIDNGTVISHKGSLQSAMYRTLVQISGVGGSK